MELVHPWFYSPVAFLIPIPEVSKNNIDAVIKPFQIWVSHLKYNFSCSAFPVFFNYDKVWVMLILATASVIVILLFFNWFLKKKIRLPDNQNNPKSSPIRPSESIYMYVVGTLLNQGRSSI